MCQKMNVKSWEMGEDLKTFFILNIIFSVL